jgi:glutamate-1-semialdehyde 2,1-aminomutase
VQYNNYDAVRELFDTRGHEIAAVIVEAVPANAGLILPQGDFNSFLREITEQHGSLFILDEVMTGFRLSVAGWYGLLQPSWTPDLITFGKVIGGGYPLAAVAGRAEVMNQLAPLGSVYQAGTLSGNPVAATAGLVTLKLCTPEVYAALDYAAFGAMQSIKDAFGSVGIPHTLQSVGNLFSVFFTNETVYSFEQAQTQDVPKFNAFFHALLNQGVYIPPSAYEAWFVSSLHDAEAMEFFDQAVRAAAQEIA